jgi:hypothetical protein
MSRIPRSGKCNKELPEPTLRVERRCDQHANIHGSDEMKTRSTNLILLFVLFVAAHVALFQAAQADSAKVSGGFGCDRNSEGSACFPDGCICGFLLKIDGEIDSTTVGKVKTLFDVRRAHKGEGETEGFGINSPGGSVAAAMAECFGRRGLG